MTSNQAPATIKTPTTGSWRVARRGHGLVRSQLLVFRLAVAATEPIQSTTQPISAALVEQTCLPAVVHRKNNGDSKRCVVCRPGRLNYEVCLTYAIRRRHRRCYCDRAMLGASAVIIASRLGRGVGFYPANPRLEASTSQPDPCWKSLLLGILCLIRTLSRTGSAGLEFHRRGGLVPWRPAARTC